MINIQQECKCVLIPVSSDLRVFKMGFQGVIPFSFVFLNLNKIADVKLTH